MSDVIQQANQGMSHREYLRAAQRMADRSMAARCWRGNSRRAVMVVLVVAAVAVAWGVLAVVL